MLSFLRIKRDRLFNIMYRSTLFIIGYILSPLSWWNDLFVNIPLAYVFALLTSMIVPIDFKILFGIGYALTNIAGIVLMKMGATGVKGNLLKEIILSIIYSIIAYLVLSIIM